MSEKVNIIRESFVVITGGYQCAIILQQILYSGDEFRKHLLSNWSDRQIRRYVKILVGKNLLIRVHCRKVIPNIPAIRHALATSGFSDDFLSKFEKNSPPSKESPGTSPAQPPVNTGSGLSINPDGSISFPT